MQAAAVVIPNADVRRQYNAALKTLSIHMESYFGLTATETSYAHGDEWLDQLLVYLEGNRDALLAYVKEPLPEAFAQAAERYRLNGAPPQWEPWGALATDEATLGNLLCLPALPDPDLRWAALLSGMYIGAEDVSALLRALRLGGQRAARVAAVAGIFERLGGCEEGERRAAWIGAVLDFGRSAAEDALDIRAACEAPWDEERSWLDQMTISSVAELDVKGDELSGYLGQSPGPWIAETLCHLLAETASGRLPNEKFVLLSAAKEMRALQREGRK